MSVAAFAGEVSIFADGAVPMSLHLPGLAVVVHPRAVGGWPTPTGQAMVEGDVSPARAGLSVQYMSKGRRVFAGGDTDAAGHFSFSVPVDAAESGLVVARSLEAQFPQIRRAKITLRKPNAPIAGVLDFVQVTVEHRVGE